MISRKEVVAFVFGSEDSNNAGFEERPSRPEGLTDSHVEDVASVMADVTSSRWLATTPIPIQGLKKGKNGWRISFVVFMIAGLAVSAAYASVSYLRTRAQLREFWAPFLVSDAEDPPITIVLPNPPLLNPDGTPVFGEYYGSYDYPAVDEVSDMLVSLGARRDRIRIRSAKDAMSQPPLGPEILIAGVNASDRCKHVLAELRHLSEPDNPDALTNGFRFVVAPGGRINAFSRRSSKKGDNGEWLMGIEDVATKELCAVQLGVTDAALIIRGTVDGRAIVVLGGFESSGTLAAAATLTGSLSLDDFNREFGETHYAEMVITTKSEPCKPTLFRFGGGVANPRVIRPMHRAE